MPGSMYLLVSSTNSKRKIPLVEEPITFGRHPANIVKLNDDRSSRYHCVIERRGGVVRITDLGSRNGTRVNEQPVKSTEIKPGDIVRVGSIQVELMILAPEPREQMPVVGHSPGESLGRALDHASAHARDLLGDSDPADTGAEAGKSAAEALNQVDAPADSTWRDTGVNLPAEAAEAVEQLPQAASRGAAASPLASGKGAPGKAQAQAGGGAQKKPVAEEAPADGMVPMEAAEGGAPEGYMPEFTGAEAAPQAFRRGMAFEGGENFTQGTANVPLGTVEDQEIRVRTILDSLDDQALGERSIVFVNARGQKMKMPDTTTPGRHGGREAVVMLRLLLLLCSRTGASDIHLEPKRDHAFLRIRVDGMMVETVRFLPEVAQKIIGVVKVLSDLDIAQKNAVQDGHFSSELAGRRVDYRVSFAPTMFGQSLVIRVLDMKGIPSHLKELGMPSWMYQNIYQAVQQDQGMLICCGPTGSGKTTTIYAAVRDIDVARRNVITIEDPPEYNIDGVTQMATNEQQGNTFASLLRSVLRQDPDVVYVGEIRDGETSRIALQAAITGHLVLTTVHAKDGIGTIFRLLDLGVEPFLVASAMNMVLSQRLIRRLCDQCKVPVKPKVEQIMRLGRFAESLSTMYCPGGCPRCLQTGYVGRQGLYELLTASEELRDVILKAPSIQQLRRAANNTLFSSLRDSGYQLVSQGITSLDEIDRVLGMSLD